MSTEPPPYSDLPPRRGGPSTGMIVLIVVASFLVLCCGGTFLLGRNMWQSGLATDTDAKTFATRAATEIGNGWDADVLEANAGSEYRASVKREQSVKYMEQVKSKLGQLKTLGEFTTTNMSSYVGTGGKRTTVQMRAPAEFEKGKGEVTLSVVKENGQWGIKNMRINSPVLD